MKQVNSQAEELNQRIRESNPAIYDLLSEKGRAIYFPKAGILKQSAEAKGKKINATIGMAIEDDGTPMRLGSLAKLINLEPKEIFPYAPSFGKPELRKKWAEIMQKKNPSLTMKTTLPVVTNALTHGLSICGYMFVNPGDPIYVTDKFWGNYRLIFENGYGGCLDPFNTFKSEGFDTESLENKLSGKGEKQILLLSLPNNPTGYTLTEEEAVTVTQIIRKSAERSNKIVVFIDDAYFGLVYKPGVLKESLFTKLGNLHENVLAVKIDGATKEDYVWGFRVGFITYAIKGLSDQTIEAMEAKTAGAVRGNISNASHLSQSLVLKAMSSESYWDEKKEKFDLLKSRYNKAFEVLNNNKEKYDDYFYPLPCNSGYFLCIELKKGLSGEDVRKILLEEYSTGTIAISNLIRIAFSSVSANSIPELFDNIYQACQKCI